MTIFNNRELDKLFDDITNRFFDSDNISETIKAGCSSGSICYGYTITIGSDGKPVVKEYGNAKPSRSTTLDNTLVDTIVDETNEQLKLVCQELKKRICSRRTTNRHFSIVVAIKRYADSFEQKKDLHDETLLKNARLSLTESMMDINLEHDAAGSDLTDLLEKFTQITQNYDLIKIPGSFRILTEDMESVRKLLESIPNVMDLSNNRLVRIKITVSEESRADVGSSVIGLLHGNGIEFVDAYFSQENMIITFNREDASQSV